QRHDTIVSGITPLTPGPWNRQWLFDALRWFFSPGFSRPGITPLEPPPSSAMAKIEDFLGNPLPPELLGSLGGVTIKYGAVERFSGSSSVVDYKITFQDINAMAASDTGPFNKFQIRLAKKAKDVYVNVGLLDVWNTINRLKAIVGDAPLPRPN